MVVEIFVLEGEVASRRFRIGPRIMVGSFRQLIAGRLTKQMGTRLVIGLSLNSFLLQCLLLERSFWPAWEYPKRNAVLSLNPLLAQTILSLSIIKECRVIRCKVVVSWFNF